jgi:hypothetical protein
MGFEDEFLRDLQASGDRLGIALDALSDEMRVYTSARLIHLSATVDQPGYLEGVQREGLNILGKASGRAVTAGDAADAELFGFIQAGLATLARLVSAGLI